MTIRPHGGYRFFLVYSETSNEEYCVDVRDKGDGSWRGTCDCWPFLRRCGPHNARDGIGRTCKHIRAVRKRIKTEIADGKFDSFLGSLRET